MGMGGNQASQRLISEPGWNSYGNRPVEAISRKIKIWGSGEKDGLDRIPRTAVNRGVRLFAEGGRSATRSAGGALIESTPLDERYFDLKNGKKWKLGRIQRIFLSFASILLPISFDHHEFLMLKSSFDIYSLRYSYKRKVADFWCVLD
jgi:hypothetical protein